MASPDRMKQLYKRLASAGFSMAFIRKRVLPEAWDDRLASDDTHYHNLLDFLSRNLAMNRESLEDTSHPVSFDRSRTRFFKGPDVTEESDAGLQLIQGVTRIALSGILPSPRVNLLSASAVRRRILELGQPWVGFRSLLSFCWSSRIPVIHIQNLPTQSRRMRGIAVELEDQNAIVLCQKYQYPARHLVPLAHELGHLAGQHMDFIGLLATTAEELLFNDRTEAEAHRYATELLTGGQVIPPNYQHYRRPQDLVEAIYEQGRVWKIDPGYLAVRRAGDTGDWREASIVLSMIEGESNALALINAEVKKHINGAGISAASRSFFTNITGVTLSGQPVTSSDNPPSSSGTRATQQILPSPPIYPNDLLQKYKELVRQGYTGQLSPEQDRQLAAIREEIQTISREDERSRVALSRVQDANASLETLEAQVDARIAQRKAERSEVERTA